MVKIVAAATAPVARLMRATMAAAPSATALTPLILIDPPYPTGRAPRYIGGLYIPLRLAYLPAVVFVHYG